MSVPMQFRADKASHLPIAIENLDTGVASKLSSVPRSFHLLQYLFRVHVSHKTTGKHDQ